MTYTVTGVYLRQVNTVPVPLTDFTNFAACFDTVQPVLARKPGTTIALSVTLEANHRSIVVRYGYSGTPGILAITLIDQDIDRVINEDLMIFLKRDGKFTGRPQDGDYDDDTVEAIVKIILDYGICIAEGLQWAALLLREAHEGTLNEYFEESINQEIH